MNDLRFAFRQLAKSPSLIVIAIITLAIGIGGNTAIFSIVDALLLRPLPYAEPDRLVQVWETPNTGGFAISCGGVFLDWQDHATQLDSIAAIHTADKNLTSHGDPVRLGGLEVSADYLRVLRINPVLGRDFLRQEDAPGGDRHVIILTHELWQSRFQGDAALLGHTIALDGEAYTVIGVLPPRALIATNVSFLVPASIRSETYKQSRDFSYVCFVIGRLKPGATMQQVQTELATAKSSLNALYPQFKQPWGVGLQTLQEAAFGGTRQYVLPLLAAVAAVLLIACANVANLLLTKAASRQGEFAVRVALGASPGRIIRQLLTESLLLAAAGGIVGVGVAWLAIDPLVAFTGLQVPAGVPIHIDLRVLLFALAASAATGVLFGVVPALSVARPNVTQQLKEGMRGSSLGGRRRLQSLLVIAETALTVVLLVAAGLLLRSFAKALSSDAGFNRQNVLVFDLSQPGSKAPTTGHRVRFIHDILDHLGQIPGVASAGMVSSAPMNGIVGYGDLISREDRPETRNNLQTGFDSVAGDFFAAAGVPLLRGRLLTEADNVESAPKAMVINQTLARQLFEQEDPLGRLLHFKDATWEIVGIVGNVRQVQLDVDPFPQVYYPQVFFPWYNSIMVRTRVPPLSIVSDVRRAIHAVDPEQPIANVRTLEQSVDSSLQGRRVVLTLLAIFAGTALFLACIGIYGVMAYSVAQRTREMGIRLALGAATGEVHRLVLRDGLRLVLIGLAVGALGALGAGQVIASQLFHVSWADPTVLVAVSIVLLLVALLACWLPARRATRVDPLSALRAD